MSNGTKLVYGSSQLKLVAALPSAASGLTVFGWIKLDSAYGTHETFRLCSGANPDPGSQYSVYAEAGFLKMWDQSGGGTTIAAYAFNTGGWIFVAIKFTNASTVSVGTITTPSNAITWGITNQSTSCPALTELLLGTTTGGSVQYFGIVGSAMSDAALQAQAASTTAPSGAWAFWALDGGAVTDTSGNSRTLTAVNVTASTSSPLAMPAYTGPAVTFAAKTLPASGDWQALATDDGNNWVTVRTDGIPAYSTDNGDTWTLCSATNIGAYPWCLAAYGNGVWVIAAGSTGGAYNNYLTSTDGINWTARTFPVASDWYALAFGNGVFVLASFNSTPCYTSPDGTTWTSHALNEGHHWQEALYANGKWVIEGTGPFEQVSTDNGVTWTEYGWNSDGVAIGHQTWSGLAYLAPNWVTVCHDGDVANVCANSQDGLAWEQQTWPITGVGANSIAASTTKLIAVPASGSTGAQTLDGAAWCNVTLPVSGNYSVIRYGNGRFISLVSGTATAAVASDVGISYAPTAALVSANLQRKRVLLPPIFRG